MFGTAIPNMHWSPWFSCLDMRWCISRRFLSQNMFVAEAFTGQPGSFVPIEETIASFKKLAEGDYDHLPEQAFFMCGGIDDVERKAAELEKK